MNDPFLFLRSLVPGGASASADTGGAVDSDTASALDSDLFAGSEPIPAEPANAAPAEAGGPGVVDSNSLLTPSASANLVSAGTTVPGDVISTMQAALIELDDRVRVIETYLRQNGVL